MGKHLNPKLMELQLKQLEASHKQQVAEMEAEYVNKLQTSMELDLITMLVAGNNLHIVSTGRAGNLLEEFMHVRAEIVDLVLSDDDEDLWKSKDDLAKVLMKVMGPESWKKYQKLFGLLSDYWVD